MCSTKELNLMFFNQNTGMRIKKPIYIFLKEFGKLMATLLVRKVLS